MELFSKTLYINFQAEESEFQTCAIGEIDENEDTFSVYFNELQH